MLRVHEALRPTHCNGTHNLTAVEYVEGGVAVQIRRADAGGFFSHNGKKVV